MTCKQLIKKYDYLEWSRDMKNDGWVVHVVNLYGRHAHLSFLSWTGEGGGSIPDYVAQLERYRLGRGPLPAVAGYGRFKI
jgi:hypothetical protein